MLYVSYSLWLIEVFSLYLFNLTLLGEITFFSLLFNDYRISVGFVISIILFIFFISFGGLFGIFMCLALILGWPFFIYSLEQEERELKSKRISRDREEIEWIERNLDEELEDFGPLLRLGKLYEEIGDDGNALKYFNKATSKVKSISLKNTERKIRQLEYSIKRDEEGKQHICKHCGKKNFSTSLLCEKCNKTLHSSYLAYIRNYAPTSLKVGLVLLVISAVLFGYYANYWANAIFYVLLITDIVLFRRRMKKG